MLQLIDKGLKNLTEQQLGDSKKILHIDLSNNQLSKGIQLTPLTNLVTLIIDDNRYTTLLNFPKLPFLQTFSANKNDFSDLYQFIDEGTSKFQRLKNLSILKNPINPFFEGEEKYAIFRDSILEKFGNLITLDGCSVTIIKKQIKSKEKEEEGQYQKLSGVAIYDSKYANEQFKTVKTRSEGHRFVKNNQL